MNSQNELKNLFENKECVGVIKCNDEEQLINTRKHIIDKGYGFLDLKINEEKLLLINGMTENEFQKFTENFNIEKSLYKNTDKFNKFKSDIVKLAGLNEKETVLYEREVGGFNTAFIKHYKNEPYQWYEV